MQNCNQFQALEMISLKKIAGEKMEKWKDKKW